MGDKRPFREDPKKGGFPVNYRVDATAEKRKTNPIHISKNHILSTKKTRTLITPKFHHPARTLKSSLLPHEPIMDHKALFPTESLTISHQYK